MVTATAKGLPYLLEPREAALLEWGRKNPFGRITIVFQDGIPVQIQAPTVDQVGYHTILTSKLAEQYGIG